jgi:hypothetical protein
VLKHRKVAGVCGAQRAPPLPPVGRDTTVDQRSLSRSRSRRSRGEPERLSLPRACRGLSGVLPLCARSALAAPLASAHLLLPSLHTDGHGTRGGADCGDCGCGGLRRQGPTRVWPPAQAARRSRASRPGRRGCTSLLTTQNPTVFALSRAVCAPRTWIPQILQITNLNAS